MTHAKHPELPLSRRHLLALAGAGTLSACGGGAGDGGDTVPAEGPTAHPLGVATGGTGHRPMAYLSANITALRPLGVGGVSLDIQGANLQDGSNQPLHAAELKLGMTARVLAGAIVAGMARAYDVQVDTQVVGDATWLDSRNLLVLGQRVHLTAATARGPGAAGTPGAVRIWGQLDLAGGRITASRLERGDAGDAAMLRGVLTSLDRTQGLVQVGEFVASAADPALLPADLAPGAVVRLVLGDAAPAGVRQLVQLRDDALRPPDGLTVALQGRVTQLTSTRAFAVDGLAVDAGTARIEGVAQLQPGAEAHVQGSMVGGVLQARSVAIEPAEPLEISGRVVTVNLAAQTFTLAGWTVHWTAATVFGAGLPVGLRAGRKLAVTGRWQPGAAALQALRVSID
jgi:hypothetical protein